MTAAPPVPTALTITPQLLSPGPGAGRPHLPLPPGLPASRMAAPVEGESTPADVMRWTLDRFAGRTIAATTGFGMEGCAMLDMLAKAVPAGGDPIRVVYIDTQFLFEETYALRDQLIDRYPTLQFVNAGSKLTAEQQAARFGDQLWESNPDLCCRLRKVEPMRKALADVDVWFSAIRREQSPTRANTRFVEWDWGYELIKVNPLAYWSRRQVLDYIQANDVPYNPLHDQGYPSIGCTHCTACVPGATAADYSRAGRWAGVAKTECGLHHGTHAATDVQDETTTSGAASAEENAA